ncbi:MAG: hypothetical protein Q8Q33_03580 [Chlamydiota bacterium]|nr:hypothetical protein [Chlamydiota bacterium]
MDGIFVYLDPGSGSMMLQILLGGIAGMLVFIKLYWKKFLSFFNTRKKHEEKASDEAA